MKAGDTVVLNMPGYRTHGREAEVLEVYQMGEGKGARVRVSGTPHQWLIKDGQYAYPDPDPED